MPSRRAIDSGHGYLPDSPSPPPKRQRRTPRSSASTTKATPTRTTRTRKIAEPTGLTSESEWDDDAATEDAFEPDSAGGGDEELDDDDESIVSVDSEELDDTPVKKSKSTGGSFKDTPTRKSKSKSKSKSARKDLDAYDDEDIELEEGQFIAGRIHPAPKTGQVPPGQISRNTLNFLACLQDPECNDREWFKSHDPAYRMAEKEHRAFVEVMQVKFNEADEELPILPARDICHRIYRDIRFSSDKTPYKCNFGLTYSRSGRRGIWAGYHLFIEPGATMIACGVWQPERAELNRIRERLLVDSQPMWEAIRRPEFEEMFGKAEPKKNGRRNVFGHSDMLKVAPKGVDKGHKDIDLLKLRSIAVVKRFTDEEVLDPHFVDKLKDVVTVMAPFVHTINDYLHPEAFGGGDSD